MRRLLAVTLCCISPALWADIPVRIEASYDVFSSGLKLVEIKEVFVRQNHRYRIESVSKSVGLLAVFKPETITATSEGEITEAGLRPEKFRHQRAHDTDRNHTAEFDWAINELTITDKNGTSRFPLLAGTQDRLSMMYQFVAAPPRGRTEIKFQVTNGNKPDDYLYKIRPGQMIEVPFGAMKSDYLYTLPEGTEWKSELWLAVAHNYVPSKAIVTEDNGNKLVQVLTALHIEP